MEVWILYSDDIESDADLAHEVRRFLAEGQRMGVNVRVMRPDSFDLLVTDGARDSIMIDGEPQKLPDFVYPYFNHSDQSYFSLAALRQLERLGVPVFNRALSIETVRDKMYTHQVLSEKGLPTPETMLAKFPVDIGLIERIIGFPLVVKTLRGALGSGVFLIEDRGAFSNLMELMRETSPSTQLIFQKFIASSKGRDLRVFIVDGQMVGCMERRAKEGDFKANYSAGGSVHAFDVNEDAVALALRTAEVLDIQVAGIDLLFTPDGGFTICEANTFPGFKGLEKACGVNVPQEIFNAMRRRLGKSYSDGRQPSEHRQSIRTYN